MAENKPVPKVGDTLIMLDGSRKRIFLVTEYMVDISPERDYPPIPIEHLAPAPNGEPNTWVLVGIRNTDMKR
jgi:hypothetical protein